MVEETHDLCWDRLLTVFGKKEWMKQCAVGFNEYLTVHNREDWSAVTSLLVDMSIRKGWSRGLKKEMSSILADQ